MRLRDARWADIALASVLGAYVIGFIAFWPTVLSVDDEERYVGQAVAFSRGMLRLPGAVPLATTALSTDYPPGTSLLQTPFVMLGGWRAAALLSVISLIFATLITRRWLRISGLAGWTALLVPGFVASLVFGRIAMSDVPSAAMVVLSLMLFWQSRASGNAALAFASGLVAALSLLFRETNAVLLLPFFVGALLRRNSAFRWMFLGGLLGVAIRLWLASMFFGSPFYIRPSGYGFSLAAAVHNTPIYGFILLVLFPFGALLPLAYRGPLRAEMRWSAYLFMATFLFYEYAGRESGGAKQILLAARYMLPLVPVLAFMAGEVGPRLLRPFFESDRGRQVNGGIAVFASMALVVAAFAVHPAMHRQDAMATEMVSALARTTSDSIPVYVNLESARKYLSAVYQTRLLNDRSMRAIDTMPQVLRRFGSAQLVILDRLDSEYHRKRAEENVQFYESMSKRCSLHLVTDEWHGASLHLRVYDISSCSS